MILYDNFQVNSRGHLEIGGCDAVELTKEYGTPLYVMDENKIRENCRAYKEAARKYFGENGAEIAFASKCLSFKEIYRIVASEGLCTDIVSLGELETAKAAGFNLEKAYFHGNNKTDYDIETGINNNIGVFVVDNIEEIDSLNNLCGKRGIVQKILLRVSPGVDPDTHPKIQTGGTNSKFGIAIETNQAIESVKYILDKKFIELIGVHFHIGSQIFDIKYFIEASDAMLELVKDIKDKYDYEINIINLGGGFGVKYIDSQSEINIDAGIKAIAEKIKIKCGEFNINMPKIIFEPGRSIVANAGATLYTVGSNKKITGYKQYISVDGSMADNPRFALYEAPYTVAAASRMNDKCEITADIVGRCCESGDFLQATVKLPDLKRGDILAFLVTGAYNYSMASNYNRLPRPAMVMLKDGKSRIVIKRESYEDLMRNEI